MLQRMALLGATNSQAALWTPAQITTALWLDAADSSTILTSGGIITSVNDKSGNSRNAIPVSLSGWSGPVMGTLSGLPAIGFNQSTTKSQGLSVPVSAVPGASGLIIGVYSVFLYPGSYGAGFISIYAADNPDIRIGMGTGISNSSYWNGSYVFNAYSANYTSRSVHAQSFSSSAGTTSSSLIQDGTTLTTGSRATGSAFTVAYSEFTLGGFLLSAARDYRQGWLQELIVIQGSGFSSSIQRLEGYLAWKWGLQANLPSNHPYKSAAPTV